MIVSASLQNKLFKASPAGLAVYAALCSFGVYFCMYAFRKPFTAAGYNGISFLHIDYKIWLVIAQVVGYMLSKFYGIRFISSLPKSKNANVIVLLISLAWLALLLFAITPAPYNIIFLFINGFPLGMVWGLVFGYLEGRKATEFMGAVLCTSFIFSSGFVKTVGKSLVIDDGINEFWMPFITGAIFYVPMLLFTWLLNHMPPPTAEDIALRSERKPMTSAERKLFINTFLPGLIVIVFTYVLLTILRDFRDNFSNELFNELGLGDKASIFAETEAPVSMIVLLCMSLLVLVRNNIRAFMLNHYIIIAGYAVALIATLLFMNSTIGAITWMIAVGTGLYLSYVPFNALYFERMIASYKVNSNVGFVMYISDSFGYLGSVLILFIRSFYGLDVSWTSFFTHLVIIIAGIGMAGTCIAAIYFHKKYYSTGRTTIKTSYAS